VSSSTPQPSEKEFYLRHFRHRSIVLHVGAGASVADVADVADELVANKTLVVVVARRLPAGRAATPVARDQLDEAGPGPVALSGALLTEGVAFVRGPATAARCLDFSCRLAVRIGAHKLVLVDPRGGLGGRSGTRSFVKVASMARAYRDGDRSSGWKANELGLLRDAIDAGVESVNLTTAASLAAELFSYEGAGTLVTAGDYATVERLRVDDFAQALALLSRGEREGFLLRRDDAERARLLLCGYGAWFEGRRLAGFAALQTAPYRKQRLAEIVGLYTITRFHGEGVGVRVVEALADVAGARGCRALFACTSNARAAAFFERNGFTPVEPTRVPAAKWKARREPRPTVFWRDL